MLQMKNFSVPLTETFKAAVCLDLAATQLGIPFNKVSEYFIGYVLFSFIIPFRMKAKLLRAQACQHIKTCIIL